MKDASRVHISAIVDACFRLIADGVSAPSRTRGDARKREVQCISIDRLRRSDHLVDSSLHASDARAFQTLLNAFIHKARCHHLFGTFSRGRPASRGSRIGSSSSHPEPASWPLWRPPGNGLRAAVHLARATRSPHHRSPSIAAAPGGRAPAPEVALYGTSRKGKDHLVRGPNPGAPK